MDLVNETATYQSTIIAVTISPRIGANYFAGMLMAIDREKHLPNRFVTYHLHVQWIAKLFPLKQSNSFEIGPDDLRFLEKLLSF